MSDVLVIDANGDSLEMLGWYLSQHGHDIRRATSVDQAFDQISDQSPEAIVLDLDLPEMSGHEFLASLRTQGLAPNAQVVVLGADAGVRAAITSWELGAADHLVRPVRPELIADALARPMVSAT